MKTKYFENVQGGVEERSFLRIGNNYQVSPGIQFPRHSFFVKWNATCTCDPQVVKLVFGGLFIYFILC